MLTWIADFTFHAYARSEGVCGIIITDQQYPQMVAHQLLSKVVDEFLGAHPQSTWAVGNPSLNAGAKAKTQQELKDYLAKYQVRALPCCLRVRKQSDRILGSTAGGQHYEDPEGIG